MKIFSSLRSRYTASSVFALSLAFMLVAASTTYATLTFTGTAGTSDGALTLNGAAASDVTIGSAATTGAITVGAATHTGATTFSSGTITGTTTTSAFPHLADAVTTGTAFFMTADALTTGEALFIDHTTAVIADGGSVARLSSSSVDTATSSGVLLDLNSTGSTAGTQVLGTFSALTTGIGQSIVADALTTGTALSLTNASGVMTTNGEMLNVSAAAATTSTGIVRVTAAALTTGSVLAVVGSANTTMTSAGSFIRVNDGTNDVFKVGYNGHITSTATDVANGEPALTAAGGFTATAETAGNGTGVATDTRGQVSFTADTDAGTAILTFGVAYAAAPVCTISPANANAQANMDFAYVTTSTTAMTINYITGTAATADLWNYICIE